MQTKILYKNKHKFYEWINMVSKVVYDDNKLRYFVDVLTTNYQKLNRKIFELPKSDTWTGEIETYYFKVDKIQDEDYEYIIIDLSWR